MEVAARRDGARPPTGVFTALIVAGIVLAGVLLLLLVRSPGSGLRLAVGNAIGTACPAGQGMPVCFDVTVTNTGKRAGADVPQLYLTDAPEGKRMRLLGFERVQLEPGESVHVTLTADPRLLARFDGKAKQWRLDDGEYTVALSHAADAPAAEQTVRLAARTFGSWAMSIW